LQSLGLKAKSSYTLGLELGAGKNGQFYLILPYDFEMEDPYTTKPMPEIFPFGKC
jgi:hypothetical protein